MKDYRRNKVQQHVYASGLKTAVLFVCLLLGMSLAYAQVPIKVTGTVTDQAGQKITGVTVVVKGTTNGTITDISGAYSIDGVPENGILLFSFIGMTAEEISVSGKRVVDVKLKESNISLEEVVAVGYGTMKKSDLTGAVSQVKSADMENRSITRAEQALQGKTAGVQIIQTSASPGSSPTIRVRGFSSNYSSDPLYVVDGLRTKNIGGIDPNDIESMEVLKDAASAAIYGAEAGNGVILITTKKGKKGNGKITYDYQLTSQSLAHLPSVLNAPEYINYMVEANYITADKINSNWDGATDTRWADVAFETSMMQKHNISFMGGNENGSFYASMSYLNNNGIVTGDKDIYNRLTGTVNADYNIKPWLKIGTNNQIEKWSRQSVSENSEYGSLLSSVLQLDPLTPIYYNADQLPTHMTKAINDGFTLFQNDETQYYGLSAFQETDNYHPLLMRDKSDSNNDGFNIMGSVFADFKPIKGLVVTSRLGYYLTGSSNYSFAHDYYANATNFQRWGSVSVGSSTSNYFQWENFANYNTKFGNHSLNTMVGSSYSASTGYSVSGSKTGSKLEDGTYDFGFIKDDPLYAYLAYSTSTAIKSISGGEPYFSRKLSYFGRATYDYAGKYLAQISLRADAGDASMLPKASRWGYFPATSLGWVVSREEFMQSLGHYLSHLKLRASWGQNGSLSSLGSYAYSTTITSGASYPFTNDLAYSVGSYPSALGNPALKWETSEQLDFGIDARFFKDRLSFSADYFDKKTKDLIVTGVTLSYIVGNSPSPINAGNVSNKGFELELGWRDKIGDFSYSVRGNLATLKNNVTYIHNTIDRINGASFHTTSGITAFEVGYPVWYFRGYKVDDIDAETGDPVFVDMLTIDSDADGINDKADGLINDDDKTMIGSAIPDFTYGFTINAAYKGIDITLFGTGSQGNDIFYCGTRGDRLQANVLKEFYDNRWTSANTSASRPRAGATYIDKYWVSDAVIFDGSYFKIKQIQLGYTVPQTLLKHAQIANLRAYVSLDDFLTFTQYPGFDPESSAGSTSSLGVDKGAFPGSKKVVFGINVTF